MITFQEAQAPPNAVLQPLQALQRAAGGEPGGFPVYPDLPDRLAAVTELPDPTVAHVLAVCAGYSYASADVVAMMMARLGLAENRCRAVALDVDPMFIASTAYVVQSQDGRVVLLAYRGTEPMNLVNWLTDADVYPERVRLSIAGSPGEFDVHAGFYRNVRATRFDVLATLRRALEGRSVHESGEAVDQPMQALYVTGHSLGGAMAALMAITLVSDRDDGDLADRLRGVTTYGAPMVGTPQLAAACDAQPFLGTRVLRYVYRDDIVPHLPPTDSGHFAHFGRELRYDGRAWVPSGSPVGQMPSVLGLVEAPLSYLSRRLRLLRGLPLHYSLDDHLPHHYVAALTPPGLPTEFGDEYAP